MGTWLRNIAEKAAFWNPLAATVVIGTIWI